MDVLQALIASAVESVFHSIINMKVLRLFEYLYQDGYILWQPFIVHLSHWTCYAVNLNIPDFIRM